MTKFFSRLLIEWKAEIGNEEINKSIVIEIYYLSIKIGVSLHLLLSLLPLRPDLLGDMQDLTTFIGRSDHLEWGRLGIGSEEVYERE